MATLTLTNAGYYMNTYYQATNGWSSSSRLVFGGDSSFSNYSALCAITVPSGKTITSSNKITITLSKSDYDWDNGYYVSASLFDSYQTPYWYYTNKSSAIASTVASVGDTVTITLNFSKALTSGKTYYVYLYGAYNTSGSPVNGYGVSQFAYATAVYDFVSTTAAYWSGGSFTITPTNYSGTEILPTTKFNYSISGANGGSANTIKGYTIYWKYGSAPSIRSYTNWTYIASTSTSISGTITLSNLTRGETIYFGVVIEGTAGKSYWSSIRASSSTKYSVIYLPSTPTLSSGSTPQYLLSNESNASFTLTNNATSFYVSNGSGSISGNTCTLSPSKGSSVTATIKSKNALGESSTNGLVLEAYRNNALTPSISIEANNYTLIINGNNLRTGILKLTFSDDKKSKLYEVNVSNSTTLTYNALKIIKEMGYSEKSDSTTLKLNYRLEENYHNKTEYNEGLKTGIITISGAPEIENSKNSINGNIIYNNNSRLYNDIVYYQLSNNGAFLNGLDNENWISHNPANGNTIALSNGYFEQKINIPSNYQYTKYEAYIIPKDSFKCNELSIKAFSNTESVQLLWTHGSTSYENDEAYATALEKILQSFENKETVDDYIRPYVKYNNSIKFLNGTWENSTGESGGFIFSRNEIFDFDDNELEISKIDLYGQKTIQVGIEYIDLFGTEFRAEKNLILDFEEEYEFKFREGSYYCSFEDNNHIEFSKATNYLQEDLYFYLPVTLNYYTYKDMDFNKNLYLEDAKIEIVGYRYRNLDDNKILISEMGYEIKKDENNRIVSQSFDLELKVLIPEINNQTTEAIFKIDDGTDDASTDSGFKTLRHELPSFSFNDIVINNNQFSISYNNFNIGYESNGSNIIKLISNTKDNTNYFDSTASFDITKTSSQVFTAINFGDYDSVTFICETTVTQKIGETDYFTIKKYIHNTPFIIYSIQPTISYRKNRVGINTSLIGTEKNILTIKQSSDVKYIILEGFDGTNLVESTIDLSTGSLTGFIIDGGSW